MRAPPPLYAVLTAACMWLLDRDLPLLRLVHAPYSDLGWMLMILGAALDAASLALFVRARTTVNPLRPERARHLVTTGLYRISRNPMYLGLALVVAGWGVRLGSATPFVLVCGFLWLISALQIRPEEVALTARFGPQYLDYCAHVNRWFGWRRGR